jgi:acetyl-CoA synthetase
MAEVPEQVPLHPIAPRMKEGYDKYKKPHVGPNIDAYKHIHGRTVGAGSDEWWAKVCAASVGFRIFDLDVSASVDRPRDPSLGPFHTVRTGGFETGDITWFPEGALNASYNCVDRWAFKHPDKVSL